MKKGETASETPPMTMQTAKQIFVLLGATDASIRLQSVRTELRRGLAAFRDLGKMQAIPDAVTRELLKKLTNRDRRLLEDVEQAKNYVDVAVESLKPSG